MFPPQLYYIVNIGNILIQNVNLMLKFTSYPQNNVDNFDLVFCHTFYLSYEWVFL